MSTTTFSSSFIIHQSCLLLDDDYLDCKRMFSVSTARYSERRSPKIEPWLQNKAQHHPPFSICYKVILLLLQRHQPQHVPTPRRNFENKHSSSKRSMILKRLNTKFDRGTNRSSYSTCQGSSWQEECSVRNNENEFGRNVNENLKTNEHTEKGPSIFTQRI